MMTSTRASAALALLLLSACSAPADDGGSGGATRTPAAAAPSHHFHPDSVRAGDTVAGLRIDSMDVRRAVDGEPVGTVRFAGEVRVSGRYGPHFDSDVDALCFFADEESSARLPRVPHDERRAWFCFENRDEARVQLRVPPDSGAASIDIDRFTYHFFRTDAVNQARLVRVLR